MHESRRVPATKSAGAKAVDARIQELGDWRGDILTRVRALICKTDPDVEEDVKWRKPANNMAGVPTWSHAGLICTGEPYKDKMKFTFAQGAALPDPKGLFNGSLGGGTRRAIDIKETDALDEKAFVALIKAAIKFNEAKHD